MVVCQASDPDGELLVYDWITDARLAIRGVPPGNNSLYGTLESYRVFYQGSVPADSGFVQVVARDQRGGFDMRTVFIDLTP
jgi:hypothetical protein